MKNFSKQWKSLEDKKCGEEPDVPNITKDFPIIKWTKYFRAYLHQIIFICKIPLDYVIRPDMDVPKIGAIATGVPHYTKHGAIEVVLITRVSHTHTLYRENN